MSSSYRFTGDPKQRPADPHADSPVTEEPYVADSRLITAVNLAIHIGRPLLLEGEAGCGKTRLASAIAYELGLPFYRWNVRSTSKAKEGLYSYDAVLRLHDVQAQQVDSSLTRNPSDATCYRNWGPLGKAFQVPDRPAVVLIDEIDKADLDFPNDLLAVLDEPWAFEVVETGEIDEHQIRAAHPPIVIITSNKEKGNLPAPFLRRCIYHYVKFPDDPVRLQEIVDAHYQTRRQTNSKLKKPSKPLFTAAATRFLDLRTNGGLFKNPGTSEFLDWLDALQSFGQKPCTAKQLAADQVLPYPELLFKLRSDWLKYATAT